MSILNSPNTLVELFFLSVICSYALNAQLFTESMDCYANSNNLERIHTLAENRFVHISVYFKLFPIFSFSQTETMNIYKR